MQLRRTMIVVLALLGALAMPVHATAVPGITPVGTLERFPQEAIDAFPEFGGSTTRFAQQLNGTLIPVFEAGQLWQVYTSFVGSSRTGILVRDAKSLNVVSSFVLDTVLRRATAALNGGEWLHATDGGRHVYLVSQSNMLLEVDTATFAVRSLGQLTVLPAEVPNLFGPLVPAGLTFDSATGDLLVLYGGPAAGFLTNRLTVLQRIDLSTGARQSRVIRACTGPLPQTDVGGSTYGAAVLADPDAVAVPCQQAPPAYPMTGQSPTSIVVRMPRASLWDVRGEEGIVGVGVWMNAPLVDAASGRISILDVAGRVTVVDARAMSVVGTFQASLGNSSRANVGAGLDSATGRFYFQSNYGFGYVDIRSTPLPPLTVDSTAAADGQERIVASGNRALVLPGWALPPNSKPDHYTVYNVAP